MQHKLRLLSVPLVLLLAGSCLGQNEDRSKPLVRLFHLPGLDLTAEQKVLVQNIQQELRPKLIEIQTRWDQVFTEEQLQLRQVVLRNAKALETPGVRKQLTVDASVVFTDAQRRQRAELQSERAALISEVRRRLLALLTDEQRDKWEQRTQSQHPPTHADVPYGPHTRNVMDIWLAPSEVPTPLLVSIHGGGFLGGDKSVSGELLQDCLRAGLSVAAITYRFSSDAIAPASFHDSARAVQYLRHHAQDLNLDAERVAATGDSAGAGISLWLGFHDDLTDPDNADPVLRESSRLKCMVVMGAQTSYDPRFIRTLIPEVEAYEHPALAKLFDIDLEQLDELPAEKYRLMEEVSPINHLSEGDAPVMFLYGGSVDQEVTDLRIGIHHARFGAALKPKMDALGIRCEVQAGDQMIGGGERISARDFLMKELGVADEPSAERTRN